MASSMLGDGDSKYLLLSVSLFFFIFIVSKRIAAAKTKYPLPPGPYAWPIVGNMFQLGMGTHHHVTLAKLARDYGPLMLLKIGARPLIIGSSPEAAREILKTNDRLLSGRTHPIQGKHSKLHNLSLAMSDECGGQWKQLRGVYQVELFSTKVLDSQIILRENKVTEMLKYLLSMSKKGGVVTIKYTVFATALNILSNVMFSKDFVDFEGNGIGSDLMGHIRLFAEMAIIIPQLADMYPRFGGWDWQRYYPNLMHVFGNMCSVWADILKDRRRLTSREDRPPPAPRDFVGTLIGSGFTEDQINPLVQEIFSSGTESTSATTEWTLTELLRNPKAMQTLRDELEQVVKEDRVRESHLVHLPYLEACVKETLRLHPPGPLLLPHRAVEDCKVMGYRIPKDSQILVNMWAIARDPDIWDDPHAFKPERFISSELDFRGNNFEYIPFGSGRRMCPGLPLASRLVPLLVSLLVHHFDWLLPGNMDPTHLDMNETLDIVMLKKNPLCVIPQLRKPFKA